MKILVLGSKKRTKTYLPDTKTAREAQIVVAEMDCSREEILSMGRDCSVIIADAISTVDRQMIEAMPDLALIHSEGVAYNRIDIKAAREHGIPVCNQKGANAAAVAEHTVMLMLSLLKSELPGNAAVLAGKQMETKQYLMVHGIHELSEMKVGLVGFGDIGKALARLLVPFGPEVFYNKRHRESEETERTLHARYLALPELLSTCDIVSLHVPVTPETTLMCNAAFFEAMRQGSYFINTARGELVDNGALVDALLSGKLAGAGLDTIAPEPVPADHPLLHLPEEVQRRVILTPHIAGVTSGFFKRAWRTIFENIDRQAAGEPLLNQVN